ncbi:unnamed protein product [Euphydryas editha]|uniref:Uncharacterized protein n=1 Tax=Euphydryas editha TaxID=104508 RepID=A0AAU9U1L8_EUPED|nr:unnamed protein product [Euphydryas editha]
MRHLARTMFARADEGARTHLHRIVPLQAKPPEGRPLPRELLLSPQPRPNTGISGNDEDDAGDAYPKMITTSTCRPQGTKLKRHGLPRRLNRRGHGPPGRNEIT